MNFLKSPKWLLLVNSLPLLVLTYLLYGQYEIIKSLLDEEHLQVWQNTAIMLSSLGLLNLGYFLVQTIRKQTIQLWFVVSNLIVHIVAVYYLFVARFIQWNIPTWMISEVPQIYITTFLMPTIAYYSLLLLDYCTPKKEATNPLTSIGISLLIPIGIYLFTQILLPLWQWVDIYFPHHVFIILMICLSYAFLFFLARWIYILTLRGINSDNRFPLIWKIPITIVLPLTGLALNAGLFHSEFDHIGIFGDFNSLWFWVLAVVNGLLLCLPNFENKKLRLLLFLGRSVCFAYTFYFFIVFLPYLPLAIVAILAIGLGFLMLTPLALFIVHIQTLSKDFSYLRKYYTPYFLTLSLLLAIAVLPTIITIRYEHNKHVLHQTLDFIYKPNYAEGQKAIDTESLQATLEAIKANKSRSEFMFLNKTPYLSRYFNYIVLDNLTLSDSKINKIEQIFFGKSQQDEEGITEFEEPLEAKFHSYNVESRYNKEEQMWHSWLNIEMKLDSLTNNTWRQGKYSTAFNLPEGCFIKDYYLYVGDKKEKGILAEKKVAQWIFRQIERRRRDPGMLYYTAENEVALEVFPFVSNEVRKTGIEFIHKEPFTLDFDGNQIALGVPDSLQTTSIHKANFDYISAEDKAKLPLVVRKPYLHFLLDCSLNATGERKALSRRLTNILEQHSEWAKDMQISLVNTFGKSAGNSTWQRDYLSQKLEGGFFVEQAIRKALYENYSKHSETYPIFVLLTANIDEAIIGKDYSNLEFIYPESKYFYQLTAKGTLLRHSLKKASSEEQGLITFEDLMKEIPVRELRVNKNEKYYLADDSKASFVLKANNSNFDEQEYSEQALLNALQLRAREQYYALHPNEFGDEEWRKLISQSFKSRVMTPQTSYIVLENEAQRAMLKKKQEDVIAGNRNLDVSEDTTQMSEPSWLLFALLFFSLLYYRSRRKSKI